MLIWACSLTPLIEPGPGLPLCPPRAKPGPSAFLSDLCGRGRHHESKAGNHHHRHVGAHDEWRKCLPVECERVSSLSKSGSRDLCEPVVLLVENDPQGAQADQALMALKVSRHGERVGSLRIFRLFYRSSSATWSAIRCCAVRMLVAQYPHVLRPTKRHWISFDFVAPERPESWKGSRPIALP
jgi:hypothetical protein